MVFDIKLENGAQKVVTVKSALVLKNKTDLTIDLKLELPRGMSVFLVLILRVLFLIDSLLQFHSCFPFR